MKSILTILAVLVSITAFSQTIGTTKTENFKASFETKIDISQFMDYDGPQIQFKF